MFTEDHIWHCKAVIVTGDVLVPVTGRYRRHEMSGFKHLKGCCGRGVDLLHLSVQTVKCKDCESQLDLRKSFKRNICYKLVWVA